MNLRHQDLTGRTGKGLHVLSFSHATKTHRYWNVKCIRCDKQVVRTTDQINRNKSCGCVWKRTFKDLSGQTKNGNTFIEVVGKNNHNCYMYKIKCVCGKIFVAEGNDVASGRLKSCGCKSNSLTGLNADHKKAAQTLLMAQMRNKAKSRNYSFDLTFEQFIEIIHKPCSYCGLESSNNIKSYKHTLPYNGIDRVDNEKGYVLGNVVPACKTCNQAKHRNTFKFFREWLERVMEFKRQEAGIWDQKQALQNSKVNTGNSNDW